VESRARKKPPASVENRVRIRLSVASGHATGSGTPNGMAAGRFDSGHSRPPDQMNDERDEGEHDENMNQAARNVKSQESQSPRDQENDSDCH
jgi:hypothetical protein